MGGPPDLSVVIPTHNGGWVLERTIEALQSQDAPPDRFEVIVVDDGSTDGSIEGLDRVAGPAAVRVLRQAQRGRAAARNLGAQAARGRALLFLDADIWAAPGLVSAHLAHHAGRRNVGVQGRWKEHPDSLTTVFMRARNIIPDLTVRRRKALSPYHVVTRNFSIDAEAFWRVGGFDEGFTGYGWEDIELAFRMVRHHVSLRFEPTAVGDHYHIQALDELTGKMRQAGEGAVYFWRKHGRPARLGFFLEIHPVLLPLKWLVYQTGVIGRLAEIALPWVERHALLPLCSEIYNHLLWRAYYRGVFATLRQETPLPL